MTVHYVEVKVQTRLSHSSLLPEGFSSSFHTAEWGTLFTCYIFPTSPPHISINPLAHRFIQTTRSLEFIAQEKGISKESTDDNIRRKRGFIDKRFAWLSGIEKRGFHTAYTANCWLGAGANCRLGAGVMWEGWGGSAENVNAQGQWREGIWDTVCVSSPRPGKHLWGDLWILWAEIM